MSLIMKGITIPKRLGSLIVLGQNSERLIMSGTEVWSVFELFRTYLVDGTFTVPAGVDTVRLCGVGGGGGGSTATLGGSSGEIVSSVDYPVTAGDVIDVIIGDGGAAGLDGSETKFGAILTLQGGTAGDYQGAGVVRNSCGGANFDGALVSIYYGGQASPFADGGAGSDGDGSFGSGGGAGATGGAGGAGRLVVRWSGV